MILFLDTSTSFCRLWLGDDLFEQQLERNMARLGLRFIKQSLEKKGLTYDNISGVVVFAGPGSFTGLRIGVTIANSLADALNIPIVGAQNPNQELSTDNNQWKEIGKQHLQTNPNKIALPFYGREARITKPRK